jgi:CRISP-associated protein Cas1
MGRLAEVAFSDRGLRQAWAEVLSNDEADGELSGGVRRFGDRLDEELVRLAADLAWGSYEPRDLTQVVIPAGEELRRLLIPSVRDRVVERAILDIVTPIVDPWLGPAAYAYRPGLGVVDAVQAVAALRDEGLAWVARTDVDDCFPSVPVGLARRMFGALVDDADLLRVVDLLLARMSIVAEHGRRITRGLPQGCALSPLLANLVLTHVDDALLGQGFPVVRYADDLVVCTSSRDEAWEAVRCAAASVERLGMELGAQDTQVMSFEEGFAFLGEDFGPRYPPATGGRVEEPDRKVLYVGLQGGRVRVDSGRLVVESNDDTRALDVATGLVARVVCFGAVGYSAGARSWALANDVDVVFASRRGSFLGTLVSARGGPRADRLRRQCAITRSTAALPICRAIIDAKVSKQIVVLKKFARREHADQVGEAIGSMHRTLLLLPDASSPDEVMGLEGAAAAAYFPALSDLLPEELQFGARSRQPPLDVANSALSLLYTVLLGECVTALHAAGLEPGIGILHGDDERRPSLGLDLLEELRPMVVDQVVVEAARQGRLTAAHGRSEDGRAGVLLTKAGRDAVLAGYERRMLQSTRGALPDFGGTIRRHVYRQAQRLQVAIFEAADGVSTQATSWSGMSWR